MAESCAEDGHHLTRKDWYVDSFLDQIMQRSPGAMIDSDREGVALVRSPGNLEEELREGIEEEDMEYGGEEGDEPITSRTTSEDYGYLLAGSTWAESSAMDRSPSPDKAVTFMVLPEETQADDVTPEAGGEGNATLIIDGDLEEKIPLKPGLSIAKAKAYLSAKRRVEPENIKLTRVDKKIVETDTLGQGDIRVDFVADVASSERITCGKENRCTPKFKVRDVRLQRADGSWVTSKVAVINCGARKQYLGGYRNKRTGEVYYHTWSQTNPKVSSTEMVTREVQTNLPMENSGINTVTSRTTQTGTPGIWISNYTDILLEPQPYAYYDEAKKTMGPKKAAEIIQQAWRHYSRKKAFLNTVEEIHNLCKVKSRFELVSKLESESQHIQLMITQSYPTNRSDFSNLFGVVNQWVVDEAMRLLTTKTSINKKAALMSVLRDEVKMLFDIETSKIRSKTENLQKQDMMFLEGTARSRGCEYPKGNVTLIDDLNIQKARMFKEMFASYKRTDATATERLDMLNCFQATLNDNFEPERETLELVDLLGREADMIIMGIADEHLVYLRKRFETLFISLMRDPSVNPQAKYFRKSVVPKKKYGLYRCKSCQKIIEPYKMFLSVKFPKFSLCKSCVQIRESCVASMNLAPYKKILEHLRASELKKNCRSPIAFLIQPFETYFIVQIIWQGRCIITGSDYTPSLRLTRWLPHEEWSMWNTILLTEHEVTIHERITDPIQFYDESFVLKVRSRNLLARLHFNDLQGIDPRRINEMRTPIGILPENHSLYVNKTHQEYIPKLKTPAFFTPTNQKSAP